MASSGWRARASCRRRSSSSSCRSAISASDCWRAFPEFRAAHLRSFPGGQYRSAFSFSTCRWAFSACWRALRVRSRWRWISFSRSSARSSSGLSSDFALSMISCGRPSRRRSPGHSSARQANRQVIGRAQGFQVKFHAGIHDPRRAMRIDLQLRIVGCYQAGDAPRYQV